MESYLTHADAGGHDSQHATAASLPSPGDGGTPALQRQEPSWTKALEDKRGASKRLVKRLKRRLINCDAVQKIRHVAHRHSRSNPSSDIESLTDANAGSSSSDDDRHHNGYDKHPVQLKRLPTWRTYGMEAGGLASRVGAVPGNSTDVFGRALVIQVLMARGVPASDLNGSSNPYCVVRCGSKEASTAIVYHCLTPRWNETFVFTEPDNAGNQHTQRVHVTLKDCNKHLPDDTLSEVEVTLEDFVSGPSPLWVNLKAPHGRDKDMPPGGWGQLCLSMWLGPRAIGQRGSQQDPEPLVTTLCAPVGSCRMLPTVVHSGPHCLFEEPTHLYLKIYLREMVVADAEALRSPQQREANAARRNRHQDATPELQLASSPDDHNVRAGNRNNSHDASGNPSDALPSFGDDENATASDQSLAPDSADEPPSEDEKRTGFASQNVATGISGDPFQDDDSEEGGNNREDNHDDSSSSSHASSHAHEEANTHDEARSDEVWLFMKVILGAQTKKTKLLLLQRDSIRWKHPFVFPVMAPLRRQTLRLRLYRAVASKARGRLVATAVIPIIDLMNQTTDLAVPGVPASEATMDGLRWFRLQSVSHSRQSAMGQAQLSFAACDADGRRQLYRQPLLDLQEPSTSGPKESSLISAVHGYSIIDDLRRRREQMSYEQQTPCVTSEPLGVLSVTLHRIELAEEAHSFCVVVCGPHWGLTSITPHSDTPRLNWQMHFPVHDPYTLFQLGVFKSGKAGQITAIRRHIPFVKDKPLLLGKLRIRLSTMQPEKSYNVALPMLAGRRNGGERTCTAHLTIQVKYQSKQALLESYVQPPLPQAAYESGIAQGANEKAAHEQQRKGVHDWLEAQQPSLPADVSAVMADDARDEFSLPRAHINFRRCQEALSGLSYFTNLIQVAEGWKDPPTSVGVLCLGWLLCYKTTIFAVLMVGAALVHLLRRQDPAKARPVPMDDDPTGLKANGKQNDDSRTKSLPFKLRAKHKYNNLLTVGLRMQNNLEDFAALFERIQAAFSWKDPVASAVVLELTVALLFIIVYLGFPTTLFILICIKLRHPALRSPTIPLPLRFYLRLPTRSDEIM